MIFDRKVNFDRHIVAHYIATSDCVVPQNLPLLWSNMMHCKYSIIDVGTEGGEWQIFEKDEERRKEGGWSQKHILLQLSYLQKNAQRAHKIV